MHYESRDPPRLTDAFDRAHEALLLLESAEVDLTLLRELAAVVAEDGPCSATAASLDRLRARLTNSMPDECAAMLDMAGVAARSERDRLNHRQLAQIAALKLLRHLYLAKLRGGQQLWILSLPECYWTWPHLLMQVISDDVAEVRELANALDEHFSSDDKKNLGTAAQDALKWALDAQLKAAAVRPGHIDVAAAHLVRRWFCQESSSEDELLRVARVLEAGFQKIASAANSGRLVFTDHPSVRGQAPSRDFEAFVMKSDRADIVYIEPPFFCHEKVFSGRAGWACTVVHELSHRELRTLDHRYAQHGLKPVTATFPSELAITNADSWAFFAADCAGMLPQDVFRKAYR